MVKPLYSQAEVDYANALVAKLEGKRIKTIHTVLESMGWVEFARGTYKVAYAHPECPTLLIKVYGTNKDAEDDCPAGILTDRVKHRFLTPIYHDKRFIIQKRANHKGARGRKADTVVFHDIGRRVQDIWGNCAYHDGKAYFFDYCS